MTSLILSSESRLSLLWLFLYLVSFSIILKRRKLCWSFKFWLATWGLQMNASFSLCCEFCRREHYCRRRLLSPS
jgi:hypothetical protein